MSGRPAHSVSANDVMAILNFKIGVWAFHWCPCSSYSDLQNPSSSCDLNVTFDVAVVKLFINCINNNKVDSPRKSVYKPGHSTKMALLSIKMRSIFLLQELTHHPGIT